MKQPSSPYPGVFLLPIPLTGSALGQVNAYLLEGPEGLLLIDTGWNNEESFQALAGHLRTLGFQLGDIKTILITHAHLDHFGLVKRVREHCPATLALHQVEDRLNQSRYDDLHHFAEQSTQYLRWGGVSEEFIQAPQEFMARFKALSTTSTPDVVFQGGETWQHGDFTLEVIWTPGHSPGHVCFHEPRHRLLFSGDHVLPHISPNIGLYPSGGPNPLGDYLASLRLVEDLDVDLVLPAHGEPFASLSARVEQLRSHHAHRERELMDVVGKNPRPASPFQLAGEITWHAHGRPVAWRELPPFDQRLAVFEVMAHLEAMSQEGSLAKSEAESRVFYHLPA